MRCEGAFTQKHPSRVNQLEGGTEWPKVCLMRHLARRRSRQTVG